MMAADCADAAGILQFDLFAISSVFKLSSLIKAFIFSNIFIFSKS